MKTGSGGEKKDNLFKFIQRLLTLNPDFHIHSFFHFGILIDSKKSNIIFL